LQAFVFAFDLIFAPLFMSFPRYMQESGFTHSAFTFVYESMLGRSTLRSSEKLIPPGALISFLQKGLQYVGIEETLYYEQQRAMTGKKLKVGSTPTSNSNDATATTSSTDITMLSLLSPTTLSAMTRENPPLQLNVPPATAAAAVRARLEAEAQIESERKQAAIMEAHERVQANGGNNGRMTGPTSIPPQPSLIVAHPLANAMEVQVAQQVAINQLQQHQQVAAAVAAAAVGQPQLQQQLQPNETSSAGTAALVAQQQRAVAEMAALEEQRQAQLVQQQLQFQQQQQQHLIQQEQREQLRQESLAAQANAVVGHSVDTVSALATVSEQMGNNLNSNNKSVSGVKRPLSAKKGPKNKGKPSKQQRTMPLHQILQVGGANNAQSGFATLEEAVARLEQQRQQQPQDATMNDATGTTEESLLQRQILHPNSTPTNELLNKISASHDELSSSQQATALQDLIMINGKRSNNDGQSHQHLPIGPMHAESTTSDLASLAPGGAAAAAIAASHLPPKEAAKAADAIIDKEDALTNAHPSEVLELKLHQSEVFMCAWNGVFTDIIATGSGDASARIWQMGGVKASDGLGPVRLLPHGSGPKDRKNKDVTTLEWSSDGKLLATGSYDGVARVWSLSGSLVHTLRGHKGPIFSLKWNKRGNFLLSGSYDKTTIVWDVSTPNGFIKQQFTDHQAPALDVDWKDDTTFASCSTDKTVHICSVGVPLPLKKYTGHTDEVNAVKWDPSGRLLASCSDDCTAKVWDVNSDRTDPLFDFKSHQQEIYTVKWYVADNVALCCGNRYVLFSSITCCYFQGSNRTRIEQSRQVVHACHGFV
jgi:hypothetical protein